MSFGGGSSPPMPQAQPQTPVPQKDDPKGLEEQRRVAAKAQGRDGYSAHLLSDKGYDSAGGTGGPTDTMKTDPAKAGMMG